MQELDDPVFGRIRCKGLWMGEVDIPLLGGAGDILIDAPKDTGPGDQQRAIYQKFLGALNDELRQRIAQALLDYARERREVSDFDENFEWLDSVEKPEDVWPTMDTVSVFLPPQTSPLGFLALQWSPDWEDEHGAQVLWREDGALRATMPGDDYFDVDNEDDNDDDE